MSRLLAVDPGVRGCGCSLWDASDGSGLLVRAAYVTGSGDGQRAGAWVPMAKAVAEWAFHTSIDKLIIELPRVYPGARQKGDQNDLIELAAVVGAICAEVQTTETQVVYPFEWKGQVPKAIHHKRALARLSAEEIQRIVLPGKSLQHNVYDAVAMGLTALKRM